MLTEADSDTLPVASVDEKSPNLNRTSVIKKEEKDESESPSSLLQALSIQPTAAPAAAATVASSANDQYPNNDEETIWL